MYGSPVGASPAAAVSVEPSLQQIFAGPVSAGVPRLKELEYCNNNEE
jgi:hypothetical protein